MLMNMTDDISRLEQEIAELKKALAQVAGMPAAEAALRAKIGEMQRQFATLKSASHAPRVSGPTIAKITARTANIATDQTILHGAPSAGVPPASGGIPGAGAASEVTGPRVEEIAADEANIAARQTIVRDAPAAPLVVLAAYAAPRGAPALAWDVEERALRDCLAPYPDRFRFEPLPRATPDDLHQALLRFQPSYLHILSHGDAGMLLFQDSSGDAHPVPRAALLQTFASVPALRCVILGACESAAGLTALGPGMPPVIAMRAAISSEAARAFAQGFYDAVAAGRDPCAAWVAGCDRMRLTGAGDADVPVFLA